MTLALVLIGGSPEVPQYCASVNVMNGTEYSSFISLGTMNLTPLINVFSQSIGMNFVQNCNLSFCNGNQYFLRCQVCNMLA